MWHVKLYLLATAKEVAIFGDASTMQVRLGAVLRRIGLTLIVQAQGQTRVEVGELVQPCG